MIIELFAVIGIAVTVISIIFFGYKLAQWSESHRPAQSKPRSTTGSKTSRIAPPKPSKFKDVLMSNYSESFKILLLGDGDDKSKLIHRFVHNKFQKIHLKTVGFEPSSRYETIDGVKVCLSIWDIPEQERFKVMRGMFFRNALGALVVFDLTMPETLRSAQKWVEEAKSASPGLLFLLIGNRNDLVDKRLITNEEGQINANKLGALKYIETSHLTGENIAEGFQLLGKKLLEDNLGDS